MAEERRWSELFQTMVSKGEEKPAEAVTILSVPVAHTTMERLQGGAGQTFQLWHTKDVGQGPEKMTLLAHNNHLGKCAPQSI